MSTTTLILENGTRTAFTTVDATDGNETVTVPLPTVVQANRPFYFQKIDSSANTVTVEDGDALSVVLENQFDTLMLVSDGTAYVPQPQIASAAAGAGDVTLNGVQTLTNKTLTSPKIDTFLTTSGATRRTLVAEPVTPVNYLADTISATGDPVATGAAGSDTNIDYSVLPKGSGVVNLMSGVSEGQSTGYLRAAAGSLHRKVKKVTSMTDATWIDLFTITVPNAAHGAGFILRAVGTLGDADSTACDEYFVAITRQSGEATVVEGDVNVTATAQPSATGAQTILMEFQCSGMTGAVGATQTFTVQGKITRGGGASDNHYMTCLAELLNQNATGITMS